VYCGHSTQYSHLVAIANVIAILPCHSCVTEDALNVKKIVQSMERGRNATTMTLRFKVFKLRYSSQLVFENVIKACRRSVDCRPPVFILATDSLSRLTQPPTPAGSEVSAVR